MSGGEIYGIVGGSTLFWLRCHRCERLLAEAISGPFRIRCRCGATNAAAMDGVAVIPEKGRPKKV